jgi:hypothetical protein
MPEDSGSAGGVLFPRGSANATAKGLLDFWIDGLFD